MLFTHMHAQLCIWHVGISILCIHGMHLVADQNQGLYPQTSLFTFGFAMRTGLECTKPWNLSLLRINEHEIIDLCLYVYIYCRWINSWTDKQTNKWIDTHACLYACINSNLHIGYPTPIRTQRCICIYIYCLICALVYFFMSYFELAVIRTSPALVQVKATLSHNDTNSVWLHARSWQHFYRFFTGPKQLPKCIKQSMSVAHQDAGSEEIMHPPLVNE